MSWDNTEKTIARASANHRLSVNITPQGIKSFFHCYSSYINTKIKENKASLFPSYADLFLPLYAFTYHKYIVVELIGWRCHFVNHKSWANTLPLKAKLSTNRIIEKRNEPVQLLLDTISRLFS